MKTTHREQEVKHNVGGHNNGSSAALAGLVIGGLAGAGAALLLAPQSGRETREQIQHKTIELRDRTVETVEDAVSQLKSTTQRITTGLQGKAEDLQHQGQEMIVEQLDRVATAAESGKAALTPHEPEKKNGRHSSR